MTACCAEQGALDFGDLVLRAHALLRDKPHVRARVAARYRHVLVDDVQDLELRRDRGSSSCSRRRARRR